jgi:C4-dicarboxylate transporter, DctQ subunit
VMLMAMPASWSYISFMKVEKTASLGIPLNWLFSIYLAFAVAMVLRHGLIVWQALRGTGPDSTASGTGAA